MNCAWKIFYVDIVLQIFSNGVVYMGHGGGESDMRRGWYTFNGLTYDFIIILFIPINSPWIYFTCHLSFQVL